MSGAPAEEETREGSPEKKYKASEEEETPWKGSVDECGFAAAADAHDTQASHSGNTGDHHMEDATGAAASAVDVEGEADDDVLEERPKKRAALQKKIALLTNQQKATDRAQQHVYHMLDRLSSQWSRNVIILVPRGRSSFHTWSDNLGQIRSEIMRSSQVVAVSLDSFRCSILLKSDEDRTPVSTAFRQLVLKNNLPIIVLTIPGTVEEHKRLAATQSHRAIKTVLRALDEQAPGQQQGSQKGSGKGKQTSQQKGGRGQTTSSTAGPKGQGKTGASTLYCHFPRDWYASWSIELMGEEIVRGEYVMATNSDEEHICIKVREGSHRTSTSRRISGEAVRTAIGDIAHILDAQKYRFPVRVVGVQTL